MTDYADPSVSIPLANPSSSRGEAALQALGRQSTPSPPTGVEAKPPPASGNSVPTGLIAR